MRHTIIVHPIISIRLAYCSVFCTNFKKLKYNVGYVSLVNSHQLRKLKRKLLTHYSMLMIIICDTSASTITLKLLT